MLAVIVGVFVAGYLAIALEHRIQVNKAASAMFIGVVCWTIYAVNSSELVPPEKITTEFREEALADGVTDVQRHFLVDHQLLEQTGEIAGILFFLMGAMTIVELIDAHEGFRPITQLIAPKNKIQLLWVCGWMTFFMSAVLDNLTTSIVMVSLLRKIIHDKSDRLMMAGLVVVAANAGGAWTVIGDVTTTMLWIKHRIGPIEVMQELLLPSIACLLVPLIGLSFRMRGPIEAPPQHATKKHLTVEPWHQRLVLTLGLAGLLSVPVFKTWTHLPPFMGMILALSVLWIVSELIGRTLDENVRSSTGVLAVLKRIDMSSVLFFLGILLAVGSLAATGILGDLARWLDTAVPNRDVVAIIIGLVSAVVDNVPLVAAGIEMYDLPMNDPFWMLLAYCAGTGGSCLIIGSAAGVAVMGLEHIDFVWYLRRVAPWALLGYVSGVAVFLLMRSLTGV